MFDLRPVGYVLGLLVFCLGVTMLVPMAADLIAGNGHWGAFAEAAVITSMLGLITSVACANGLRSGLPRLPSGCPRRVVRQPLCTVTPRSHTLTLPLRRAPKLPRRLRAYRWRTANGNDDGACICARVQQKRGNEGGRGGASCDTQG